MAKRLHQVALDEASKLKLEIKELQGLREKYDEACLELSRIRSKHAGEMEIVKKEFDESRGRLIKEAAEERNRLSKMLGETEERIRQLNHCVHARDERIKWHQEKIIQLNDELSVSRAEVNNKQLKINDLKGRVDQVKADKLRALDEAKDLAEKMARQEVEVERVRLEGRSRLETLQEELVSSCQRSSELESRVAETEGQVSSLRSQIAEAEQRLAFLRGAQDATYAEAFKLGMEETRVKISQEHPEWDLSFLEVEDHDARTPGTDLSMGIEYEEVSDSDADGQKEESLPSEVEVPEAHRPTKFEVGRLSHAPSVPAVDTSKAGPVP